MDKFLQNYLFFYEMYKFVKVLKIGDVDGKRKSNISNGN